jgi:hypothetical protein
VKALLAMALALLPAIATAESAADATRLTRASDAAPLAITLSGTLGYSFNDDRVVTLSAEMVTNSGPADSGPLRLVLLFRSADYPYFTVFSASYEFASLLGANVGLVDIQATVPFNRPPAGCYTPTLAVEELVDGAWTRRDYADFLRSVDFGNRCIASFTASPAYVVPGGAATLTWSTLGSVDGVTIDRGVGAQPANGSVVVTPAATTTYTLTARNTANTPPPSKTTTVTVGPPLPPRRRAVGR